MYKKVHTVQNAKLPLRVYTTDTNYGTKTPRARHPRVTLEDRSLYSPNARERQHTHQGPPDELARRQLAPATAVDRDGAVVA